MEIINDPDMVITETVTTLAQIDCGDVFRFAHTPYKTAIKLQEFFVKQEMSDRVITVRLVDCAIDFDTPENTEVIVHLAKVVVLPND